MGYQLNIVFLNIVPYSNYQKSCFVNYKRSMYLNSKLQQKTQQQQYMRSNFLQRIQILTVHVSFCSQWENRRYINRGRAYEAAYVSSLLAKILVWCFSFSRSSGSKFIGLFENNYDKYCIFFVWSFFVLHKSMQLHPVRFLFKIIFTQV